MISLSDDALELTEWMLLLLLRLRRFSGVLFDCCRCCLNGNVIDGEKEEVSSSSTLITSTVLPSTPPRCCLLLLRTLPSRLLSDSTSIASDWYPSFLLIRPASISKLSSAILKREAL